MVLSLFFGYKFWFFLLLIKESLPYYNMTLLSVLCWYEQNLEDDFGKYLNS